MSTDRASMPRTRGGIAIAGAATAGALVALALGAVDLPDPGPALSDASRSLGGWTYLVVPVLAFLETGAFVGLVVPGEIAVVVGGVAAQRGDVALPGLIALVWLGALARDLVSFALGRRLGRPFLDAHGPRLRIRPEHVERVERFFAQYAGRAVLLGRFVGILRALTPFIAGASRLPLMRFLPYSALGALGWAATFTMVGYAFAGSFESAGETATRIALGSAVLIDVTLALATHPTRRVAAPRPGAASRPGRQAPPRAARQRPPRAGSANACTRARAQPLRPAQRPEPQLGTEELDRDRRREGGGAGTGLGQPNAPGLQPAAFRGCGRLRHGVTDARNGRGPSARSRGRLTLAAAGHSRLDVVRPPRRPWLVPRERQTMLAGDERFHEKARAARLAGKAAPTIVVSSCSRVHVALDAMHNGRGRPRCPQAIAGGTAIRDEPPGCPLELRRPRARQLRAHCLAGPRQRARTTSVVTHN